MDGSNHQSWNWFWTPAAIVALNVSISGNGGLTFTTTGGTNICASSFDFHGCKCCVSKSMPSNATINCGLWDWLPPSSEGTVVNMTKCLISNLICDFNLHLKGRAYFWLLWFHLKGFELCAALSFVLHNTVATLEVEHWFTGGSTLCSKMCIEELETYVWFCNGMNVMHVMHCIYRKFNMKRTKVNTYNQCWLVVNIYSQCWFVQSGVEKAYHSHVFLCDLSKSKGYVQWCYDLLASNPQTMLGSLKLQEWSANRMTLAVFDE